MQELEYLQLSVTYYSSSDKTTAFPRDDETLPSEDSAVWKGLQNYLDTLGERGWTIIKETQSDRGRQRTYNFRRPFETK
jgi:hypothetical protein